MDNDGEAALDSQVRAHTLARRLQQQYAIMLDGEAGLESRARLGKYWCFLVCSKFMFASIILTIIFVFSFI